MQIQNKKVLNFNKWTFILFFLLWGSACTVDINKNYAHSDWKKMGLKGKVKSVKGDSYKAIDNAGQINKGERGGDSWRKNYYFAFLENGKVAEADVYLLSGILQYKTTILYDKEGNKSKEVVYKTNDSILYTKVFVYDSQDNIIEEVSIDPSSEKATKRTFKNDRNGNKIEEYRYFADNGKLSVKIFYTYDKKNRKIQENMFNSEDRLIARWISKYDENDLLIEENYFNSADSLVAQETYLYKLDHKGNWTQQIIFENGKPKYIIERILQYF